MRKKSGYTPWAAQKPPLFNTSLNTTYIRLSSAALLAVPVLIIGVISGLAISKRLPDKFQLPIVGPIKTFSQPAAINKSPPLKLSQPAVANRPPESIVPAIPMMSQINTPKSDPMVDLIVSDYKMSVIDAETIVSSANEASAITGVDKTLLLAIAAKLSNFKDGNKWIGIMHVRPEMHPKEVNKLKEAKVALSTINGSFRLGAEVLASYQKENGNDIKASVTRLIGPVPAGDNTLKDVLNLKNQLEELK